MTVEPVKLTRFLEPTLSHVGFELDEIHEAEIYEDRPAWSVFYTGRDCRLQICWSARDGGIDLMLAPLDAPNEFGLVNQSKKWKFMLLLSDAHDNLATPRLDEDDILVMSWLKSLFEVHFEAARNVLLAG